MASSDPLPGVKALLFDVFGTTVDWRSTVTSYLHKRCQSTLSSTTSSSSSTHSKASSMTLDSWGEFAAEWRKTYHAYTKHVVQDKVQNPKSIDQHHFDALNELLEKWELTGFWNSAEVEEISLIWHKLDPWPDTSHGLTLLKKKYTICTLSNGNQALLSDMAEYANLPWSHIFSAADFGSFKPDPRIYLGAAEKLGVKPEECCMVAAHLGDLKAARGCGFRAVYVERRREEAFSDEEVEKAKREGWVDVWVGLDETEGEGEKAGFVEAARRLTIQ